MRVNDVAGNRPGMYWSPTSQDASKSRKKFILCYFDDVAGNICQAIPSLATSTVAAVATAIAGAVHVTSENSQV